MKKIFRYSIITMVLVIFASCQKSPGSSSAEPGFLSFGGFHLSVDEELVTKADAVSDNYSITVINSEGMTCLSQTYAQVLENGDAIPLPAGAYTLVVQSLSGNVPSASWENPIYGISKGFTIKAGEVTEIGNLVCTLLQCKVTVSYSEEFIDSITGDCSTSVTVRAGYPLDYALDASGKYDQRAGYFAVEGNTMEVLFKGSVNGKTVKMTKIFTGIAPKQWRQVKFIQKKNVEGNATFDLVIQDLISDEILNNDIEASEEVIGEDPEAPKGDGGITLDFDYEAGCDQELTELDNMLIVPLEVRDMNIMLRATVPAGVLRFTVDIESDNAGFNAALEAAGGSHLDLVDPSEESSMIFEIVPFPHGSELVGKTDISFDLSVAQEAIIMYPGTHRFMMTIVDSNSCSKKIPVTMVVE